MCDRRQAVNCIVPPYMLRAMMESEETGVRESAIRTLLASTRLRAQREVVGALRTVVPTATAQGRRRAVHDAAGRELNRLQLPGRLVRGEDAASTNDEVVNEAYDALGHTLDFYDRALGRRSIDDRGMPLVATVHWGQGFNNAFWNGTQMVFGDGDGVVFGRFTRSLDIIAHELTHGVVDHTSALEYSVQSGALNESFADVFGSLVKQFTLRQGVQQADWLIGAELLAPGVDGKALRSMKAPGTAYNDPKLGGRDPQPDHMDRFVQLPDDEFNDFGGVHINSGIPNKAFFLVAHELGGHAWEDAGTIWYEALQQLFERAQFGDCANITTQIAAARFGDGSRQHRAVRTAWQEVGVVVDKPQPAAPRGEGRDLGETADAELGVELERIAGELQRLADKLPAYALGRAMAGRC
jgi:Zn-dependent metalloprotease